MFEVKNILRLLTIISALLMISAGVTSFIINHCVSDIIIGIHIILIGILIFYYEFFNQNNVKKWFHNHYIFRLIMLIWNNFLILGINKVTLGFGIYGIIIGIANGIYYLINKNEEEEEI